jgi:hypothetical protein
MTESKLNRRQLVAAVGGVLGGGVAGVLVASDETPRSPAAPAAAEAKPAATAVPWTYHPLDPDAAAERAFAGFQKGRCMYGVFEAIVGPLGETYGDPYRSFPVAMMKYGHGGVNGWGSLCGALNGAAAAFQLLSPDPNSLIDETLSWCDREALPDYVGRAAKFTNVPSVSGSPLCHVSISRWCRKSGKKAYSQERDERCACLTASVTRHAVALLNRQAGGARATSALPAETVECQSCHEKGGAVENARSKMTCPQCHGRLGKEHPGA